LWRVGPSFTRENKLLIFLVLLKIQTNQEKNKALKMSTTKPFSQWTVIALREFLKERGVRSSGLKAQLVYKWR
jgi:hypothetical protein